MFKMNRCVAAFAAVIVFISCQKEVTFESAGITPPIGPGTVTGSLTAKIDGVSFAANQTITATIQAGVIVLYGSDNNQKSILLRVADSGVHNYSLTVPTQDNVGALTDSSITPISAFTTNGWTLDGNYGNLNITSIDTVKKKMSGTFQMKVIRQLDDLQRTITDGVFTDISYTGINDTPPLNASDTFRVKVDGTDFTYALFYSLHAFDRINITASKAGGFPAVGLSFPDTISLGAHPMDNVDFVGQYNTSTTDFTASESGELTILEYNKTTKRIRGNFNFKANYPFLHTPPDYFLTDGYFSVKYE